jgi:citrate synthase
MLGVSLLVVVDQWGPTKEQTDSLTAELHLVPELPAHPSHDGLVAQGYAYTLTQFTIGLAACQTESEFAKAYQDGCPRRSTKYALEDILSVVAKLPELGYHLPQRVF